MLERVVEGFVKAGFYSNNNNKAASVNSKSTEGSTNERSNTIIEKVTQIFNLFLAHIQLKTEESKINKDISDLTTQIGKKEVTKASCLKNINKALSNPSLAKTRQEEYIESGTNGSNIPSEELSSSSSENSLTPEEYKTLLQQMKTDISKLKSEKKTKNSDLQSKKSEIDKNWNEISSFFSL
jgi:hypothetical protein